MEWYSKYSDSIWAGQSRDLILVQATLSAPVQTDNGAHPASYTMGTGSSWEYSGWCVVLTTHPHLEARLKKNRAIPLLYWPFMACQRLQFIHVLKMHILLGFLIIIIIIIIIYLPWSWATCWLILVSCIQKSLQRSAMIPSASWRIVFHYPG